MLGPLLFIIYMIDITDDLDGVDVCIFADDTKNWQVTSFNFFQRELGKMYSWAKRNNSFFNGKKFIKTVSGDADNTPPLLDPDGNIIKSVVHAKDLGVYVSSDMSFDYHINTIVLAAQRMFAWALRTFRTREVVPMLTLLRTLIVSKVEYASILWCPTDITNIKNLESVQVRFTSKIGIFRRLCDDSGFTECTVDYWERLIRLHIYSLQRRRERYQVLYMCNIHLRLVPDLGFLSDYHVRTGTKYFAKYNHHATAAVKTLRYSSFFTQGPVLYNLLPAQLRAPSTANTQEETDKAKRWIKRRVDKWLELIPDEPPTSENLPRTAESNSIVGQMGMHGRDIRKQWELVSKKLDKEEEEKEDRAA